MPGITMLQNIVYPVQQIRQTMLKKPLFHGAALFVAVTILGNTCAFAQTKGSLPDYVMPPRTAPHGIIKYQGVLDASVFMIDGYYAEDSGSSSMDIDAPPAVKIFLIITLLPVFLIKGIFSVFFHDDQGLRVTPGDHTVRIGYWTDESKWVARDFDVTVPAGEAAVIETLAADAGSPIRPDLELITNKRENVTVFFNIRYEPLAGYSQK